MELVNTNEAGVFIAVIMSSFFGIGMIAISIFCWAVGTIENALWDRRLKKINRK